MTVLWVASPAAGRASHLTSLAQLNLASCTREDVLGYLDNTWALTELLFASLQGEASFYLQPYHQLRHCSYCLWPDAVLHVCLQRCD